MQHAMRCQSFTSVKTMMLCHEMWTTSCAHRTQLSKIWNVCKRNDRKFFLLGKDIKGTQVSVRKLKEVVDVRFKQMEFYLVNATLFLARTSFACDHVIARRMRLLQAIRNYLYQMGTLYTHLKAYREAFSAFKISVFSTISSLAGGNITPQLLLPHQIAEIVKKLAEGEITRGTKLSLAIRSGFQAIFYEIQLILEVTLIPRSISVLLGISMNSKS